MHDIPAPTDPNTHLMSYADDLTVTQQHPKHETAAVNLQVYINQLEDWLTTNRLKVSPNKSSLTLITPHNKEITDQPLVTLYNTPIPVNPNPTLLGVTLDPMLTFRKHTDTINIKAKRRLNVLRALTHTNYGHSKEHITTVYKQFIRPILTYAHTAWQPLLKDTNLNKLQVTQNAALRTATGCTKTTPNDHVHQETKVLRLQDHMDMRGTHSYTSYTEPQHPLHYLTHDRPLHRHKRDTPAHYYSNFYNTLPPTPRNTSLRTHIHTHFANRSIYSMQPNTILNSYPPPTSEEEKTLSREERVHLSRFRCGHHPVLPSYMHRINLTDSDTCTLCNNAEGSLEHILLHCTHLQHHRNRYNIQSLEHLWTHPVEVCNFLQDGGVIQSTRTSPPHTQ